jgi:hypothetical protein
MINTFMFLFPSGPSVQPTVQPTGQPTRSGDTLAPSMPPTPQPTTRPSSQPSIVPTASVTFSGIWNIAVSTNCSQACGGGSYARTVTCQDRTTDLPIDPAQCVTSSPAKDTACNILPCPAWTASYSTTCTFVSCTGARGVLNRISANCEVASSALVSVSFFSAEESSAGIKAGCPATVPSSTKPCDSASFDNICNITAAGDYVWLVEDFDEAKCSKVCPDTLRREVTCFQNGSATTEEAKCSAKDKPASTYVCTPTSQCQNTGTCDGNAYCSCPHGFSGSKCELAPELTNLRIMSQGAIEVEGTLVLPRCPACEITITWEQRGYSQAGSESDLVSLLFASVAGANTYTLALVPAGLRTYIGRVPEDLPDSGVYTLMAYLGDPSMVKPVITLITLITLNNPK